MLDENTPWLGVVRLHKTPPITNQSIKIWMKYIVRMKLALSEQNAQGFLYLILYPASISGNSMPIWKHLFKVGRVEDTRRHNQTSHGVVGHVYAIHLVLTISLNYKIHKSNMEMRKIRKTWCHPNLYWVKRQRGIKQRNDLFIPKFQWDFFFLHPASALKPSMDLNNTKWLILFNT